MKKSFARALAAALIVAASTGLGAVTFGTPDGNRHPYVGTILFERPDGYFSCSGTLMSPTVFLTAGHCVEGNGDLNLNTWLSLASNVSFAGIEKYPTINAFFDDPKNGWIEGTPVAHPQYDDFNQFPATFDIGVVLLKKGVKMSTYGALPPEGFLETIQTAKQNTFTAVGYGLQGLLAPFFSELYARYQGQVQLVELNSTSTADMSAKFTNNPGTGGGSCFGDSGGPVLYANTSMVVAVVSWGRTPCIGNDYQFRVDTALALDFLADYLP